MSNTINTYAFAGSNQTEFGQTFTCLNGHCYMTTYIDVTIFYSPYVGASQIPSGPVPTSIATPPGNLPPLGQVVFYPQIWKTANGFSNTTPASKDSTPVLIYRQDIFDAINPTNCLGTKFTFASRVMTDDCVNAYVMVWSTEEVSMPYGGSEITIAPQNGVSAAFQPCD